MNSEVHSKCKSSDSQSYAVSTTPHCFPFIWDLFYTTQILAEKKKGNINILSLEERAEKFRWTKNEAVTKW